MRLFFANQNSEIRAFSIDTKVFIIITLTELDNFKLTCKKIKKFLTKSSYLWPYFYFIEVPLCKQEMFAEWFFI